jgi:hypothetical protein
VSQVITHHYPMYLTKILLVNPPFGYVTIMKVSGLPCRASSPYPEVQGTIGGRSPDWIEVAMSLDHWRT